MGRNDTEDHTVQITGAMIDELDRHLGWNDKPRSYRLMMAVLHATREWLSTDEKAALAVGFPVRLCGTQCDEPWHASTMLPKSRRAEDFLARVDLWFKPDPVRYPAEAVAAVVDLLSESIIDDRIEDMCRGLPVEFQPGSLT